MHNLPNHRLQPTPYRHTTKTDRSIVVVKKVIALLLKWQWLRQIRSTRSIIVMGMAVLMTALSMVASLLRSMNNLEESTLDWCFLFRGRTQTSSDIVLIFIDETTAATLPYRSPIPRDHLAALIDTLHAAGARAIGLDIFLDRWRRDTGDEQLRTAIEHAGNVVLVSALGSSIAAERQPHPYFARAAAGIGYADFPVPLYGTVRSMQLMTEISRVMRPSFATALYAAAKGQTSETVIRELLERQTLNGHQVPQNRRFISLINFIGPPSRAGSTTGSFRTYSSGVVTAKHLPDHWFRNKIIMIGSGLEDAPDLFNTPFSTRASHYTRMHGVEVHANAVHTLLNGSFIKKPDPSFHFFLVLGLTLLTGWSVFRFRTLAAALFVLTLICSLIVGNYLTFDLYLFWFPLVTPTVAIFFTYLSTTTYKVAVEEQQKRQIRRIFEKYVAPTIVAEIMKEPEKIKLGGEEREMTVMFTDLTGFTSIAEALSPNELVALINNCLTAMTEVILEHGGTVDKYEGDAILCFWGAPMLQPDHATRACLAALAMQERLTTLQTTGHMNRKPPLRMRIGINSGRMAVGNMGSEMKFDYTVMGDNVNLAARLESANKVYGTQIMISEFTYEQAKFAIAVRELDRIIVKGKTHPVRVYELIERASERLNDPGVMETYITALNAYYRGAWHDALVGFQRVLQFKPGDGPSLLYVERCQDLLANPPLKWDGVFTMKTK